MTHPDDPDDAPQDERRAHERLKAIFTAAGDLPRAAREAFLVEACAGDERLRLKVERLLAMDDSMHDSMHDSMNDSMNDSMHDSMDDRSAESAGAQSGQADAPRSSDAVGGAARALSSGTAATHDLSGTSIGAYRLVRLLGGGGFGVVYVAERHDLPQRPVALKLVRPGMDSGRIVQRFTIEREALATLDHPHIARIIDVGETGAGQPYFVMELVDGTSITRYCDDHALSIRERLELFLQVCRAVQHAHDKEIVHRDIKPSNVLVATHDGAPFAKLIDLGIAKLMNAPRRERDLSQEGQIIGTIPYMSPEQARAAPDINARTDVYSLGATLYELLTGAAPLDSDDDNEIPDHERLRRVREVEPPTPSARLMRGRTSLGEIAARRSEAPSGLIALVRDDLDWIVTKSIEKDRERRYPTVEALAADVQRHLDGRPVLASPPSRTYLMRKFVRRHRGAVIAAGAVMAALVLGLAMMAVGLVQARRAEVRARFAAEESGRRARETAIVADLQAEMLRTIQVDEQGAGLRERLLTQYEDALKVRRLTDDEVARRVDRLGSELAELNTTDTASFMVERAILAPVALAIDRRFGDQPLVTATLRQTVADAYRQLGRHQLARPLQEQALLARQRLLGPDDWRTLESQLSMGELDFVEGRMADAETMFRNALVTAQRLPGADNRTTVRLLGALGKTLGELRRFDESKARLLEALELSRRVAGVDDPETAKCVLRIGALHLIAGMFDEAEPWCRQAVAATRAANGPDARETADARSNLAAVLLQRGKIAEAEPLFRETLAVGERTRGARDPWTLSWRSNLGELLKAQGKLIEAEQCLREVMEGRKRWLPQDDPETLASLVTLGAVLHVNGDSQEAERLLRDAVEKLRRLPLSKHPETLAALEALAVVLRDTLRFDEADGLLSETIALHDEVQPDDEVNLSSYRDNLGELRRRQARLDEADDLLQRALEARRRLGGPLHPDTLASLHHLASLRRDQGRGDEAERLLREVVDGRRESLGPCHPDSCQAQLDLGMLLLRQGRFAEAESSLVQSRDTSGPPLPPRHPLRTAIPAAFAALREASERAEAGAASR